MSCLNAIIIGAVKGYMEERPCLSDILLGGVRSKDSRGRVTRCTRMHYLCYGRRPFAGWASDDRRERSTARRSNIYQVDIREEALTICADS